jgi:predicted AlkP superfamily phosphohydrolase/phosphomutase
MTYPVEEINGVMIAQTNTRTQLDTRGGKHVWKGTLLRDIEAQVYPPERSGEMMLILESVENELSSQMTDIFGEFKYPLSDTDKRLWRSCRWSFRADEIYRRIALKLVREDPKTLLFLLYLNGSDVVGHRFWRFMRPRAYQYKPSPEQVANFGHVIKDYYRYMDRILGQLWDAYGQDVTIFIVSDHGMKPINIKKQFNPDDAPSRLISAHHKNAEPGVFFACGPDIRKSTLNKPIQELVYGDLKIICSVFDITPTILAMMRIPVSQDMDGRIVTEIFKAEFNISHQPPAIATHDTPEFISLRRPIVLSGPDDDERMEQLRSLGYILTD